MKLSEEIIKNDESNENTELSTDHNDEFIEGFNIISEKETIINHDEFFFKTTFPRCLGNTFAFFYKKDTPLIIIGPDWRFYVFLNITIAIVFLIFNFLSSHFMIKEFRTLGLIIYIFQILSYFLSFSLNPGVVIRNSQDLVNKTLIDVKICAICRIFQDPNLKISHCKECDICIEGHDHHCPWISKCVGKGNKVFFLLFILTTLFLFIYMVIVTIISDEHN